MNYSKIVILVCIILTAIFLYYFSYIPNMGLVSENEGEYTLVLSETDYEGFKRAVTKINQLIRWVFIFLLIAYGFFTFETISIGYKNKRTKKMLNELEIKLNKFKDNHEEIRDDLGKLLEDFEDYKNFNINSFFRRY